jgi:hypothetical protein
MTEHDPRRLLDDPHPSCLRRALLESAIDHGPTTAQVDALWGALSSRLPVVGPGGAGSPVTASGDAWVARAFGAGMGTKITALAALIAVAAVSPAILQSGPEVAGSPVHAVGPPSRLALDPAAIETPAVETAAVEPSAVPEAPEALPAPAVPVASSQAHPAASTRREARAAASAPTKSVSLHAEALLVLHARQSIRTRDCDEALRALNEGQARFGAGPLLEEREALGIEALACAGRETEAANRAEVFLREHPASLHAPTVRRFVH